MRLFRPFSVKRTLRPLAFISIWATLVLACEHEEKQELKAGLWRGEFEVEGEKIPFNFEVKAEENDTQQVYLLNADERVLLEGIKVEKDSVVIPIELFDAFLIGKKENTTFTGFLRKNQGTQKGTPFQASFGEAHRFETNGDEPAANLSGKWDVEITSEGSEPNKTVGLFRQEGKKLTGTIMTTTGDYRYFEGVTDGNQFFLSAFSGSSPRLMKGTITDSVNFSAELISAGGKSVLKAVKNDQAALPDAYTLTYLKEGVDRLDFSFPDLNGKPVSLRDDKYKNKVVVVTLLGSWCPNCMDENAFLSPWYKENKSRGVEIVGVAFERKDEFDFAKEKLTRFVNRYGIDYDILFAGKADKKAASEKLPQLNAVLSFPTTLLIDKQGKVRKIHTGFTGPATGSYYDEFVKEFNSDIDALLAEKKTI